MFYVYGTDGRQFAGSLETLLGDPRIQAVGRIKAAGQETAGGRQARRDGKPPHGKPASPRESEAAAAYRKTILAEKRIGPLLHASQIMSSPVLTVAPADSIDSAWKLLQSKHIRHLPVLIDREGKIPVLAGMLAEIDFYRDATLPLRGDEGMEAPVSTLMRTPVYTADPLTDIRRIAQLMFEKHIGCMPVVGAEGTLDGIITRSDILHALINHPSFSLWG